MLLEHTNKPKKPKKKAFTIIELLAVLAIMGVILVIAGSMMGRGGAVEAARAARSEVRGVLTRARSEAITTGRYIAVAMPGYQEGPEEMRGNSLGLFEVRKDEAAGNYASVKQLRRWVKLPGGIVFKQGFPVKRGAVNAFAESGGLRVSILNPETSQRESVTAAAVIFNPQGGVDFPAGSGELELQFGEGSILNGQLVASRGRIDEAEKQDILLISRLTGRVRMLPISK